MNNNILIAALLPIAILLYYIARKDKFSPEPTGQLLKAFFFGILSIPVSMCISGPLCSLGFFTNNPATMGEAVATSFYGAAIPEEIAKFLMFWLVVRKNRYFDEKMDGIVYAVCVSLGFAAFENVMYLVSNSEAFVSVGIARALFAVPGHFCFGIAMGYYYSLARFYPGASSKTKALVLVAPIIIHGLYDSILFVSSVTPAISGILMVAFLIFCHKMWKFGSKKINEHLNRDQFQF
jgi:RsiW-degrading membrane proteinase PrsW (M82 family)